MTKICRILLKTTILWNLTKSEKLGFSKSPETDIESILLGDLQNLDELQETTPDFCLHPSNWYKDLTP